MKFFIHSNDEDIFLAIFDKNKKNSDAWCDDQKDAFVFTTEKSANACIKKLIKFGHDERDLSIKNEYVFVNKTLSLTNDQFDSLLSTLECVNERCREYGSFGNSNTRYDYSLIEKVISQLK